MRRMKSYDFFEMMPDDCSDFYYMVRKWYEDNPEVGVRAQEGRGGECWLLERHNRYLKLS